MLQNTEDSSRLALRHPRRAQSLAFPGLNAIVTGCEDGTVTLWDSRAAEQAAVVISQAHKTRVKGIAPLSSSIADQQAGLVASAASDGSLKLWDFRMLQSNKSGMAHGRYGSTKAVVAQVMSHWVQRDKQLGDSSTLAMPYNAT